MSELTYMQCKTIQIQFVSRIFQTDLFADLACQSWGKLYHEGIFSRKKLISIKCCRDLKLYSKCHQQFKCLSRKLFCPVQVYTQLIKNSFIAGFDFTCRYSYILLYLFIYLFIGSPVSTTVLNTFNTSIIRVVNYSQLPLQRTPAGPQFGVCNSESPQQRGARKFLF